MFGNDVTIRCNFQTYHLFRWHEVPPDAIKLSEMFHEGVLSECRQDHFAVDALRNVVKRTYSGYPTAATENVIDSARRVLKDRHWVIVKEWAKSISALAVPPGVSVDANIKEAAIARFHLKGSSWFYEKVRNGGEWDYKQRGSNYQNFGNFNYGATGAAFGFSEDMLLRMAGWAQVRAGTSRSD